MPVEYDHQSILIPNLDWLSFLIPPVLMLIIQQTLLFGIGMHMGSTREEYIWIVSYHSRKKLQKRYAYHVTGKSLAYFMLYFIMAIYMFTFVNRCSICSILGKISRTH